MQFSYSKVIVKEGSDPLIRRVKCLVEQSFQSLCPSTLTLPKLVIFDYDNTLVDSWPQDFQTSNETFKALGHPTMTELEMLQQPHTPAVNAIVERTGVPYESVKEVYNSVYQKVHEDLAPPIPGAEELLTFLNTKGIKTAVVSNKEQDLLLNTIEKNKWDKYFHTVYGASPNKPYKPDPTVIDEIIKELPSKISPEQIFFVGDALSSDISCALRGNVVPVWMSGFSIDEVEFKGEGPKILKIENCKVLKDLIEGIK